MKEIYLVVSETGIYDERFIRTVCAYSNKDKADVHAKLANERAKLCRFNYNNYSIRDDSNETFGPLDPEYSPRYSGEKPLAGSDVKYTVKAISLLDEVPKTKPKLTLGDIDFYGVNRVSLCYSGSSNSIEFTRIYEKANLLHLEGNGGNNQFSIPLETECEMKCHRIYFKNSHGNFQMFCYYPTRPSLRDKD